jgi:hypothetical protein
MAGNRNIPGVPTNDLKQSLQDLSQNSPFGASNPENLTRLDQVEKDLNRSRLTSANRGLIDLAQDLEKQRKVEERLYRERKLAFTDDIFQSRQKESQARTELKLLEGLVKATKERKDITDVDRRQAVTNFQFMRHAKEYELDLARQEIATTQQSIRGHEKSRRVRLDSYEDSIHAAKRLSSTLGDMAQDKKLSLLFHIGNAGSLNKGLQNYGRTQLVSSLPNAMNPEGEGFSAGGMIRGGMALGLGLLAETFIDQMIKAFTRNYQFKIGATDVFKGTGGGARGGTEEFMEGLRHELVRYGVTRDEIVALGQNLRPQIGEMAGGQAGFRNVMQQGISLDRAFGSSLGTGGSFLGDLIRKSSLGGNKQELSQFSKTFSEALGSSGLIGLQEETAKGVVELVELTRRSNIYGADPNMFVRMIADISGSSNAKNIKGLDAARVLESLSQGIANPPTAVTQLISMIALRSTLAKSGNPNTRALAANGPALLNLQAEGLGLNVNGESLGENVLQETLQSVRSLTGMNRTGMNESQKQFSLNLAKQLMSRQYGISPQTAEILLTNPEMFSRKRGGTLDSFGLGKENYDEVLKPGAAAYIKFLAAAQKNTGVSQASVNTANDRIKELLGKNSEQVDKAIDQTKGKSLQEQSRAVMEAAAAGPLTDADKDRGTVEAFKSKFEEWAGKVLNLIEALARHFHIDMSDPKKTNGEEFKHSMSSRNLSRELFDRKFTVDNGNSKYSGLFLDTWAEAIKEHEGFMPGKKGKPTPSVSFRNNNPGNLTGEGDLGFEMLNNHKFRKYSTLDKGMEALKQDLEGKIAKYPDYTLLQIMTRYLGGDPKNPRVTKEGDPFAYAAAVGKYMGVSVDTKLKDLGRMTSEQMPKQTTKETSSNQSPSGDININYTHTVKDPNGGIIAQGKQTTVVDSADLNKPLRKKTSFGHWGAY